MMGQHRMERFYTNNCSITIFIRTIILIAFAGTVARANPGK